MFIVYFSVCLVLLLLPTVVVSLDNKGPSPTSFIQKINVTEIMELLNNFKEKEYNEELPKLKRMFQVFLENSQSTYNNLNSTAFYEWLETLTPKQQALMIAAIILGAIAVPVGIVVLIQSLGWGASGVVAGSLAAKIQAAIGIVQAGSIFATLQSIGATGIGLATTAVVAASAGIGALLGSLPSKEPESREKKAV